MGWFLLAGSDQYLLLSQLLQNIPQMWILRFSYSPPLLSSNMDQLMNIFKLVPEHLLERGQLPLVVRRIDLGAFDQEPHKHVVHSQTLVFVQNLKYLIVELSLLPQPQGGEWTPFNEFLQIVLPPVGQQYHDLSQIRHQFEHQLVDS